MNKGCHVSKYNYDFELDEDLIIEILSGKVALFTGAGISTESRVVLKSTFYEAICNELKHEECTLTFPELMEEYCKKPNGRIKLINKINERFNGINSFPELYYLATRFHRELSTMHFIETIVTTNWDDYFEKECHAIPFVEDKDLAFWDTENRKVLKIHGSVNNYGSIIATSRDYKRKEEEFNKGIIGSVLKTILSTQTVIFIGYSLSDSDFNNIYSYIKETMQDFHKQAYIVTPFKDDAEKFRKIGIIPIVTDGAFFLNKIKSYAIKKEAMLPDSIYENAENLLKLVSKEHEQLHKNYNLNTLPEIIYVASYQDGMTHALDRAINWKGTGEYSNPFELSQMIEIYEDIQKDKEKDCNYMDVAYIEGYMNALLYLLYQYNEKRIDTPPLYYSYGVEEDLFDFKSFRKIAKQLPKKYKNAHSIATKYVDSLEFTENLDFHHPPWL